MTEDPRRGKGPGGVAPSRPWPFLVLALGLLGVGISFWRPIPAGVWHDDGVYMLIGESLAQGEGLRYLGVPANPPAVKFPPLYPAVLGILWMMLGSVGPVTLVAVWLNLVLMATAGGLLGWVLHEGAGIRKGPAVAIAALAFVSADLWRPALVPLSEALFIALSAGAMAAWPAASRVGDRRGAVTLSVLLALAVLTRSAGLALVVGFGTALLLRRSGRAALSVCAPALAAAASWAAWASAHADEIPPGMRDVLGPYGAWLAGQVWSAPGAFVGGLPAHTADLAGRVLGLLVPGLLGWPLWVAGLPLLALAAAGVLRLCRRFPPLVWVPAFYLAMLLTWPFVDRRLVAPVHPWIVALVGVGILSLADRWSARGLRWGLGVVAFAWISSHTAVTASRAAGGWPVAAYQLRSVRLAAAVEALRNTAPEDAVVGAPEFWAALHLHGGWSAAPSARFTPRADDVAKPLWGTPMEQLQLWWDSGVDFVLLEQGGQIHGAALDLLDERCPGAVRLMADFPPQLLVRLDWDEACAESLGLTHGPANR
ncbi:MAG TPA: hypothetical protein VLA36_04575 [Longimicrobiales bacterium]|nr:hypothetical protein [Longimicrobiales bacterium]